MASPFFMSDQISIRKDRFAGEQLLHFFTFTHETSAFVIDHHFGGAWARVVVRAHDETVRARREDREQIALFDGELPVLADQSPLSQTGPTTS